MIYLPDTNGFSLHLRGRDDALSARLVKAMKAGQLRLSLVVLFELRYGAEKALLKGEERPAERVAKLERTVPVAPLPVEAAARYGSLRAFLERRGETIGAMDMLLAAHALALSATIVTNNVREFRRVPDLKVRNWQTP